jgi:hypothetical protein
MSTDAALNDIMNNVLKTLMSRSSGSSASTASNTASGLGTNNLYPRKSNKEDSDNETSSSDSSDDMPPLEEDCGGCNGGSGGISLDTILKMMNGGDCVGGKSVQKYLNENPELAAKIEAARATVSGKTSMHTKNTNNVLLNDMKRRIDRAVFAGHRSIQGTSQTVCEGGRAFLLEPNRFGENTSVVCELVEKDKDNIVEKDIYFIGVFWW